MLCEVEAGRVAYKKRSIKSGPHSRLLSHMHVAAMLLCEPTACAAVRMWRTCRCSQLSCGSRVCRFCQLFLSCLVGR
jgi:hypothetical protein